MSRLAPEHDSTERRERPFHRAARFGDEETARQAYLTTEQRVFEATADISAYRFQLDQVWHVAVVADEPPSGALQRAVEDALSQGEQVNLHPEILATLLSRHREVMRHRLPWVEGHYHPGRRVT